jgi:hypothetical protein
MPRKVRGSPEEQGQRAFISAAAEELRGLQMGDLRAQRPSESSSASALGAASPPLSNSRVHPGGIEWKCRFRMFSGFAETASFWQISFR